LSILWIAGEDFSNRTRIKQKLRELDYRKPQEETTHLVAAVESKAHLRQGKFVPQR
jgi:hypothetical protein